MTLRQEMITLTSPIHRGVWNLLEIIVICLASTPWVIYFFNVKILLWNETLLKNNLLKSSLINPKLWLLFGSFFFKMFFSSSFKRKLFKLKENFYWFDSNKQWYHGRGWQMKGSLGINIVYFHQLSGAHPNVTQSLHETIDPYYR